MRQDYIEPDYVNGVQDADGNLVIPPLDDEAKRFLNSYYEEVIGANFMHDPELRKLYTKMKTLKSKTELTEEEEIELDFLQLQYFQQADESLLYPDEDDQRKIYGENNARNRCLFNRSRASGTLESINNETFNDGNETGAVCPESGERLSLDKRDSKRKVILRKKT